MWEAFLVFLKPLFDWLVKLTPSRTERQHDVIDEEDRQEADHINHWRDVD